MLYLPHGHCICRTDPVSAAQTLYLPRRHCICHTDTVSAAHTLYLPHTHGICYKGTTSATQILYLVRILCTYLGSALHMRSSLLFEDASEGAVRRCVPVSRSGSARLRVRKYCSKMRPGFTFLGFTLLCCLHIAHGMHRCSSVTTVRSVATALCNMMLRSRCRLHESTARACCSKRRPGYTFLRNALLCSHNTVHGMHGYTLVCIYMYIYIYIYILWPSMTPYY